MKFQKRGLPLLGAMAVAVGSLLAWGAQPAQANSESRGDGPAEIGSCGADIGHIVKFTIQGTTGRVAQDTGNETKYALEWTESGGYLNVVAIWWDTNNDGVHDATEPSAPFSRLRLYLGGEDAHDYPFEPAATTAHLGPFGDANITHVLACMADVGYLRIMKIWETTSEVVPPRSEPPRYDLVCRNEAYPGGASTLTAKTEVEVEGTAILPGSTCTVREVAVPNNGWIEDPDACEFTFAAAETGISGPAPQIAPEMSFVNTAWWLTKTAVATKTVSYPWTLTKVASPTGLNLAQGTTGEITYTLTPVRGELAENSNLSGAVTVGGIRADLLKQVTVVDNDTVLACNSEGLCAYTFRLKPGVVEGTNSAHATYTNGLDVESLEVSTPFEVTPSTAPITPKLVDAFNGGVAVTVAELATSGTASTYKRTFACGTSPAGATVVADGTSVTYPNVAQVLAGDVVLATASANVTVSCAAPVPTVPATVPAVQPTLDFRSLDVATPVTTVPPVTTAVAPTVPATVMGVTVAAEAPKVAESTSIAISPTVIEEPAFTGSEPAPLALLALALMGLGALALLVARRRQAH